MKLLLHTCCGPCFLGVWEELSTHKDIDTSLYYFNPNIYPESEYEKRYSNLVDASTGKVKVIKSKYQSDRYKEIVSVNNIYPERCLGCYRLRLEAVAKHAIDNGYDCFSTTLLVSPYQQHDNLKIIAEDIAKEHQIEFYYQDWRPYFGEGQSDAREIGLYRQKYCGCEYSLNEVKQ